MTRRSLVQEINLAVQLDEYRSSDGHTVSFTEDYWDTLGVHSWLSAPL